MKASPESWRPEKPTSKGATAYHDAVAHASWYGQNLGELTRLIAAKIRAGDTVADFGAGTGVSSIDLFQAVPADFALWLVDNSPAWLGKAYEALGGNPRVKFLLLEKRENRYATLAEVLGEGTANHVFSANTFHLIPDLDAAFQGIARALKPGGSFTWQSGNIIRDGRHPDILMIDDTVKNVHDLALELVRTEEKYAGYRPGLQERIDEEAEQRKFVFPEPRPIAAYLASLDRAGFACEPPIYKTIKVPYAEWLGFLRVKRLQAGILPEIGSREPTPQEEQHRDELITAASQKLFRELAAKNKFADEEGFSAEWVYTVASKR